MKVVAALYVQPKNTQSEVMVKTVKPQGERLGITVENTGSRHKILKVASLTLNNGNELIQLRGDQLLGLQGKNILAKSTKRFFVEKPAKYRDAVWTASLSFSK